MTSNQMEAHLLLHGWYPVVSKRRAGWAHDDRDCAIMAAPTIRTSLMKRAFVDRVDRCMCSDVEFRRVFDRIIKEGV